MTAASLLFSCRTEQPIPAERHALVLARLARDPAPRPLSAGGPARRLAAVSTEPRTDDHVAAWWVSHGRERLTHSASGTIVTFSTDNP